MLQTKFPARIHILLAREAPAGLVIRRGPSRSVCTRKLAFAESGAPPGRGCYWDAHELKHEPSGTLLAFPEWEWADLDRKRFVWAANGQLWAAHLGTGKLLRPKLLHDFNSMKFEAIPAPY